MEPTVDDDGRQTPAPTIPSAARCALVEALDEDGAEPDDRAPTPGNELTVQPLRDGGGTIKGRFEDAAMFAAV